MIIKKLGITHYELTFESMKQFTNDRDSSTADEIWITEHQPVFTQGQAGKPEHILVTSDIPIIKSDRGGQVTYHGPGQTVIYPLIDIKRSGIGVRQMINILENNVVDYLMSLGVEAYSDAKAPGVYVGKKKIASLGLRVRKGRTYHGVAINVDMDLMPFSLINPCGYQGLQMTQLKDLVPLITPMQVGEMIATRIVKSIECC